MARFRTNRNVGQRRPAPNRNWAGTFDAQTFTAGGQKQLLGTFALSNAGIDETVLRTVGVISVFSDQVAASEDQQGAIGMIVVSDQAISTGISAIPGPISDITDDGWFLYVPFLARFNFADGTGLQPQMGTQFAFDSKAKRVVHDGQSIALVGETTAASEGCQVNTIIRMLSMVRGT